MASLSPPERRSKLPKVKQACDCCHARKIRCDGVNPCANCETAVLQCTYYMVHRKTGPKGPREGKLPDYYSQKRGKVVGTSVNTPRSLRLPIVPSEIEHGRVLPASKYADINDLVFEPSPLLSDDIIKRCVYGFFKHKYPIMPVLDSEHIHASLPYMRND